MATNNFVYQTQVADHRPLESVLADFYGIYATYCDSVDVEQLMNEFKSSMQKQCCKKFFRVVLIDQGTNQEYVTARLLAEQKKLQAQSNSDRSVSIIVVKTASAAGAEGKRVVSQEQLASIVSIHKQTRRR